MGGVSMERKEVTLGEIGTIVGGATPSTKNTSFYDGNIPWLTPKDLSVNSNKYIFRGERNITEAGFKSCSCKMLPKGSVLFSSRAPIGYVAIAANDMCTNQGFKSVIPNEETDSEFLYYLLKYNKDNIASQGSGTTFAEVSGKTMKDIEVVVPKEKEDQHRIASILSSLDRKIELNNKINADLEEMAQAIFKNWFVDFEPFKDGKFVDSELGMIPEGWKVGTLGEFCKCLLGGTPSRSKEEYWNGEVNWINSGEINKFRILEASEKITELGLAKSATKLLPKKTTVLAITGATLGQVSLLEIDTCANQSVIGVLENTEVPYEYIYPFIKDRIEMLIQHQTGGAQQHINKDNVESLIFLLPAINVLEDYISLVSPMYKRIESQCFENLYLSTLRDTLLPRLMSGELEVPE